MSVSEMKLELAKLDKIKDDLSYLVGEVNDKTREIKYLEIHREKANDFRA